MTTFHARRGDIDVEFTVVLKQRVGESDEPVDLTAAETVRFRAYNPSTTEVVIEGVAVKHVNQSTHRGRVTYTLTASDLAATTGDTYDVLWLVDWQGGGRDSFPRPKRDTLKVGI